MLSKFEAFKQNSEDGPYKIEFERKFFDFLKSLPENTDDKIVKFNNPLSDKEFNVIKDILLASGELYNVDLVDARQEGDKLIFNYNTRHDNPEGEQSLEFKNTIGLNYKANSGLCAYALKIQALDNGGYVSAKSETNMSGSLIKYFDKDLNLKDKDWYRQEKALKKKIEKELSAAQMETALENIKNGKPAQYKLDDNYLILLPKPDEQVVGNTSLSTRATTSCEELRQAIDNLPPEVKAMTVISTIAVGGIMVEAVMIPTAPMIALGAELATFKLAEE